MKTKEMLEQLKAAKANLEQYKSKRLGATSASAISSGFAAQEKSAVAKFGVKSLNDLIKINTADRRYKAIPAEDREAVKNLKEAVDVTLMCAKVFNKTPASTKAYEDMLAPALKAFGINTGEQGANWVPTVISESYVEEFNLERKVAGLFTEIKMPSNPFQYPVLTNGAIATRLGENSKKTTPDQFSTSVITMTAVKLTNQYELPEELQEDSAVDVMKVIRQELIDGQEKEMEVAILEGDTAATHQHTSTQIPGASGAPSADSSERIFDGLRKRARAAALTVDCGGVPVNESKLSLLRKTMGKFGTNPAELALICGPIGYNEMLGLDDVRTIEQLGPKATVLSGQLASYEGIAVVVSEYLREDTDATGINGATPANNVYASMILLNRKRWFTGLRRAIQIKVESFRTQFDVWDMVSFSRKAFDGTLKADGSNGTTEKSVAMLYHIG
jgi:HK97 family phage major capsid protein